MIYTVEQGRTKKICDSSGNDSSGKTGKTGKSGVEQREGDGVDVRLDVRDTQFYIDINSPLYANENRMLSYYYAAK